MIGEHSASMPATYCSWCPGLLSEPRFYSSQRADDREMPPEMHRTWEFSHCDSFECPHCGAVYSVRYTQLPVRDSESAYCENCHRKMSQWHSTAQPCYTLIARPEGQMARTAGQSLRGTSRGPFLGVGQMRR